MVFYFVVSSVGVVTLKQVDNSYFCLNSSEINIKVNVILILFVRMLTQIRLTEYTCLEGCEYLAAVMPNFGECSMKAMCENFSVNCCGKFIISY